MKTKAEVLYAQERNIQNIFEAVTVSFFKRVIPDVEMNDKAILSIMENAIGTTNFEEFKTKYEGKPLGKFLVEITENLQDVNLFRFEAMAEDIAIAESENPYMLEKTLHDGIDSEFESLVLTDNIKNELAGIIKDDIIKTEENAKKDAELAGDLDDIDPDSDEFDPNALPEEKEEEDKSGSDEDDDNMQDEDGEEKNVEIEEAAWAKVTLSNKDIENDNFEPSIEKLVKDKTLVEVDISTKKSIQVRLHNLALEVKSTLKGMITPDFMNQLKGNKADQAMAKYYAWIMTKGCEQTLNNYLMFILGFMLSIGIGVGFIMAGYALVGYIFTFTIAYANGSYFTEKTLPRMIVTNTLGSAIAVKLQDMKNKAATEEERTRIETIRNEFMAKAKITEMMCSEYRGMTEAQIKGNLALITESYNTSFTKVLEEVVSELSEGAEITESLTSNAKDIAVMAASMMLVKELYLEEAKNDDDSYTVFKVDRKASEWVRSGERLVTKLSDGTYRVKETFKLTDGRTVDQLPREFEIGLDNTIRFKIVKGAASDASEKDTK